MIIGLCLLALAVTAVSCLNVTFDNRAFLLNGERTLFIGGSIHYPRAHSAEWPQIISQAKASGLNLIETYVFWDIHEPKEGVFYFPSDGSSDDIVAFINECQTQGVYVSLRFGPYVCAEWNYGGFPVWLRDVDGITFRTMNDQFLDKMTKFVDATLKVVTDAKLLASEGGPIVMMQIENEYGNMQKYYPQHGDDYVQWAANYALNKNLSVPWIMCQQGEGVGTAPPAAVINTCNGYYCDHWIAQHAADFPNQPHMWTENWPGWFQHWGEGVPHRPAVDVAFAVARWYARGGSFSNYYMAFGGTTFGRQVGGPLIITSYDYDVQINEYGLPAEPKFTLLQTLHRALYTVAPVLMAHDAIPATVPLASNPECESITYDVPAGASAAVRAVGCVTFLSNWGTGPSCTFDLNGESYEVPPWSVSVLANTCSATSSAELLLNTRTSAATIKANQIQATPVVDVKLAPFTTFTEPVPSTATAPVLSSSPVDQLTLTQDHTDYLWISADLPQRAVAGDALVSFAIAEAGGSVLYVYVNGKLAASTIDTVSHVLSTETSHNNTTTKVVQRGTTASEFVQTTTKRASKREVDVNLAKNGEIIKLKVHLPSGAHNKLSVLYCSTGVKNYGPYLEKIKVGVISKIHIDGVALAAYSTVPGLNGEKYLHQLSVKDDSPVVNEEQDLFAPMDASALTSTAAAPLTWYKTSFSVPASVTVQSSLALDLSATALIKGAVWVNGFMLGRYWNIVASTSGGSCDDAAQCTSAAYTGGYSAERCRTGCGALSQTLYKVPVGLLHAADSGVKNELLFFEEVGGSPEGLVFKTVAMVSV